MPMAELGDARLHHEVRGSGVPVLTFAPGGPRSRVAAWSRAPWSPLEALSDRWRVIAMDQRNAGRSWAPVRADDGWHSYAADHLALLDHLGVQRCHLLGMCIGGAFICRLLAEHPDRFLSAVLLQPIGHDGTNRALFEALYDGWQAEVAPSHPEASAADFRGLRDNLYGGDFVFSESADAVGRFSTPLLVLEGDDAYHPRATSREIVRRAPRAEAVGSWKEGEDREHGIARVRAFLAAHDGENG